MITWCNIIGSIIVPMGTALGVFLIVMSIFRQQNFDGKGKRKKKKSWRNLSDELRSSEIEYHNKAIYKAFEFYIKIMLALCAGISFIGLTKHDFVKNITVLIQTGGVLIIGVTLLFCILVISHQKGKIERWKESFTLQEALLWNEAWFLAISIPMAAFIVMVVLPYLLTNLI